MVLRRFRRKRDSEARRYAYSRWDGSQSGFELNAYDLFAELSDELIHHGDPNSALRNLLQQGFDVDGNHIQGLRELLEQLREEREQRLENHDLGGVYDEIAQELRELVAEARKSGDDRRSDLTQNSVTEKNVQLDLLPSDLAGQVKGLENYDFQSQDSQQRFDDLMEKLREQLMQQQLDQMAEGVNDMSPEDMQRMKDMMAELNNMLDQRQRDEEPDFAGFMDKFGDFFPENPETLDELLEAMAQRMAAAQAMLNSMTPEQRAQMQALSDQLLEDMDLKWQVDQLGQNLQQMFPDAGWEQSYDFSGYDPLDMGSAMDMMGDLNDLDQLENMLRGTTTPGALAEVDIDRARELMGDDAANSLEQLSQLSKKLEESGLVDNNDGKLELTPRAIRRIANQALSDLFAKLAKNTVGQHEMHESGQGHEREYTTKPYEWGDPFNLHIGKTIRNAITRTGGGTPVQLTPDDFEVERTETQVRSSTVLMLDMSLSMPMRDNFLPAKKVAMALYGLISSQYPRDYLGVVGFSDVATVIEPTQLPGVQWDFVYGTNMQHGFMLARDMLKKQSGTKQIIMITDGEPTAHLDDYGRPQFNYPPIQETIDKTLIEVNRCTREDIRINVFMLDATPYLTRFIEKITQLNGGRAFFTTPQNLGDYVLVDFVEHKRAMRTGRR
jgi:uncharacterized protein with von Willebrand factor type A (vWA) domain